MRKALILAGVVIMRMAAKTTTAHLLTPSIRASLPGLYETMLHGPLDFGGVITQVVPVPDTSTTLGQVVVGHGGGGTPTASPAASTVVFVVRRPGCVLCREHGQQLSELAAKEWNESTVSLIGIIKETGVDDAGLVEFHRDFFSYPLYLDAGRVLYQAFGSRRISLSTWNPWRLWKGFQALGERMKRKNIEGNLKGEGMIQGGILIFDRHGELQYAYEEDIGSELDMGTIQSAVKSILLDSTTSGSADEL
jgi:hypothetical protein